MTGKKKKKETDSCCESSTCIRVEYLVNVDERGQMVLPKEIRDKAGINPGDKLAVVALEREGKFCCITLIKMTEFEGMVKGYLGPVMKDIVGN